MKIFILSLLLPSLAFAQDNIFNFPIDSVTGKIAYQGIVSVEKVDKADLFNRIKLWVIDSYNSPKDVINSEDKDIGVIKLKPVIKKQKNSNGLVYDDVLYFDLTVFVKDNKYKYVLENIQHSMLTPHAPAEKNPIERPFLFSKDNLEQMKYFDYRRSWSDDIKRDIETLLTSIRTAVIKKPNTDF